MEIIKRRLCVKNTYYVKGIIMLTAADFSAAVLFFFILLWYEIAISYIIVKEEMEIFISEVDNHDSAG